MENQELSQTQQTATLNLNSIMIGTSQPKVLAEFYEKVFNRAADMVEDNNWYMWQAGGSSLSIGEHSEVKGQAKEPARIMLNLETKAVKEEFERGNTHACHGAVSSRIARVRRCSFRECLRQQIATIVSECER